ncbi:hypothetical protein ACE1B6_19780 [Aerosakkonemataceae cyanobacterium BLCC-F154]|uniref:Uncharacterized protein n=1 Tax=Floridaenema fluviatile BLCC-F154 TaxID=3153640 RepID=A0ABV4YF85_9CYAN
MRNPILNLHSSGAVPIFGKLLVSSLILGLIATVSTNLEILPSVAQPTAQTKQAANPINKKLVGSWQSRVSSTQNLTFIFGPDGKLFIVLPSSSEKAQALQLRYRVASTSTKPMHLDLTTSNNKTAQTIFEFTPNGQLRMELQGIEAGKPRPGTFGKGAMVFNKVSNNTNLPPNAQLRQTNNPNNVMPR